MRRSMLIEYELENAATSDADAFGEGAGF